MKQIALCLALLATLAVNSAVKAQDTYVPLQSEEAYLLDRLESLTQKLNSSNLGSFLPIGRQSLATYLEQTKNNRYKLIHLVFPEQINII